jgi:sialic acid synthase SpsE
MGIFDQFKMAGDLMKNMNPGQIKELMEQAKESQRMLDSQIRKIVEEEIKSRGLISKSEVEKMVEEKLKNN